MVGKVISLFKKKEAVKDTTFERMEHIRVSLEKIKELTEQLKKETSK